jgi:hypothetical protein
MTLTPEYVRRLIDDGTETYQPIAEYLILKTIQANPQIESNQLRLLMFSMMDAKRFNRAYKVTCQLKYNGLKVVLIRPNAKEQRWYASINPKVDLQSIIGHWYSQCNDLEFDPPVYRAKPR